MVKGQTLHRTFQSSELNTIRSVKADENDNRQNQHELLEVGLNELVAEVGSPAEIRFEFGPEQTCSRTLNGWNLT